MFRLDGRSKKLPKIPSKAVANSPFIVYCGLQQADCPKWSQKVLDTSFLRSLVRKSPEFSVHGPQMSHILPIPQEFQDFSSTSLRKGSQKSKILTNLALQTEYSTVGCIFCPFSTLNHLKFETPGPLFSPWTTILTQNPEKQVPRGGLFRICGPEWRF